MRKSHRGIEKQSLHELGICRTAPETGIVRNRALQRGRDAVAQHPEVRAEALDYEPDVLKVHGSNARQKGVEATHEPLASSRSHRGDEVAGQNPLLTSGATRFTGSIRDR